LVVVPAAQAEHDAEPVSLAKVSAAHAAQSALPGASA
jgi:hypothetical protein